MFFLSNLSASEPMFTFTAAQFACINLFCKQTALRIFPTNVYTLYLVRNWVGLFILE